MKYLLLYLLLINAAGLVLMLADKIRARNGAWRISEMTLMLTAALGGSVGVHMGMYLFRHKTRHPKFTLGVPAILTVQILLAWFLL
ncbi:MAG: DUF1294 domain-containing protein [Oscillospiraceae bacterium]|nr:DUF1294 domain-containing protein [Oscillospiraceae bacterium]